MARVNASEGPDPPRSKANPLFGVLDLLTGVAALALLSVLWSASWVWPAALSVWAALLLVSAFGLFAGSRWGRTAARVAAIYQLGFLIVLIIGILSSAAYLRGVYGQIGVGIAAALLLILALLIELMGLLPIFKLRHLGLTEGRSLAGSRHLAVVATVVLVFAVSSYCVVVHARASIDTHEPVPDASRHAMAVSLMAAIGPDPETIDLPAFGQDDDRWIVRVYRRGRLEARVEASGTLEDASRAVAASFAETPPRGAGTPSIVIDRVVGETSIEDMDGVLGALSVVPGLDGVSGEIDGTRHTLVPHELVSRRMLSEHRPVPFIPEFEIGLDPSQARTLLCETAKEPADCDVRDLRRARTETWVHRTGETTGLYRGRPMVEHTITADDAHAGAVAAAEYVRRSLRRDGRFVYQYSPQTGRREMEPYSIPRHAGTSWFLLEVYDATGNESFLRAAERALDWLEARMTDCGDGLRCIREGDRVALGPQALPLIAFAAHANATGSERYQDTTRQLAETVLRMQRDDGDFDFALDPTTGQPVDVGRHLYAGGQGALGLALSGQALGDDDQLQAARSALDFMAGPYWDFFLSDLFFIEEHWTCLAADEVHRLFGDPSHARLCLAAAGFDRQLQHAQGQTVFPDYVGGIGFSPFFPPYSTTAAGRTEGTIAAYRISARQGDPEPALLEGIEEAVGFLLHNQYDKADVWAFHSQSTAIGGVPWNYYDPVIRIDTVQHTGSVLLHGAKLMRAANPN